VINSHQDQDSFHLEPSIKKATHNLSVRTPGYRSYNGSQPLLLSLPTNHTSVLYVVAHGVEEGHYEVPANGAMRTTESPVSLDELLILLLSLRWKDQPLTKSISDCFFTVFTTGSLSSSSSSSSAVYIVSSTSPSTRLQWLSYAYFYLSATIPQSRLRIHADSSTYVESAFQLAVAAQFDNNDFVDAEAHEVEGLSVGFFFLFHYGGGG